MNVNQDAGPLGIVLSTVTDGSVEEFVELGRLAEAHGYAQVLVNEGRGDAIAVAQAIAAATSRVTVGTNIANIYFRHPFLCAASARTLAEVARGRTLLGLGMSHRGMLESLGIDMGDARGALERYVGEVVATLAGEHGSGLLRAPVSRYPLPVYVAGNTVESAAVAGRVGAGLMPFLTPRSHLPVLLDAAHAAAAPRGLAAFGCVMSIPSFLSDVTAAARSAARYNLAFFSQLPNYRRQWRRAGWRAAMDALAAHWRGGGSRREAAALVPDDLVDEVCVLGDASTCRAQLAAFRAAGATVPVLAVSPVNEDRHGATRRAVEALAPG
ncbi:MAG: LLM class flavin-dependent oxidoreductase [Gammaproteobacteria bacterium]